VGKRRREKRVCDGEERERGREGGKRKSNEIERWTL
jgi:hypothetical protein